MSGINRNLEPDFTSLEHKRIKVVFSTRWGALLLSQSSAIHRMIDKNDPLYKVYTYGTRYGIRLTGRCFGVHGLAAYYEHITDQFGMREGDES